MIVELQTGDGGLVGRFEIPPFQILPEILVWGSRTFVNNGMANDVPIYREGLAFVILSEAITEEL